MVKKVVKSDIKPEWKLLYESENKKVDQLFDIYRMDKRKAKVIFNQNNAHDYNRTRVVLFEFPNGDFKIINNRKNYGISISGIIYSRERTESAIIYKDKKFYYAFNKRGKKITQLTFNYLHSFINQPGNQLNDVYEYIQNRFGWLRNLSEASAGHHLSFNTIVSKKLFNEKVIYRHVYDCPYPIAKLIHENRYNIFDFKKFWSKGKRVLANIEALRSEMFKHPLFYDTINMADSLGHKINCSWSMKRFKQEHDKWMKEIVEVILEFEPLRNLKLNKAFIDFARFSGYEILLTNHDLIAEGKMMNHCVGTYSINVDSGRSGIYRVGGYTLELVISKPYVSIDDIANGVKSEWELTIGQLRGFSNASPPKELDIQVRLMLSKFNELGYEINGYKEQKSEDFIFLI